MNRISAAAYRPTDESLFSGGIPQAAANFEHVGKLVNPPPPRGSVSLIHEGLAAFLRTYFGGSNPPMLTNFPSLHGATRDAWTWLLPRFPVTGGLPS